MLTALLALTGGVLVGLFGLSVWPMIGWARRGEWLSVIFAVGFWAFVCVFAVRELREAQQQGRDDALRELRDEGFDV